MNTVPIDSIQLAELSTSNFHPFIKVLILHICALNLYDKHMRYKECEHLKTNTKKTIIMELFPVNREYACLFFFHPEVSPILIYEVNHMTFLTLFIDSKQCGGSHDFVCVTYRIRPN